MIQLNPYLPLMTPTGYCECFAMSDMGEDCNVLFYCFTDRGIICVFDQQEVRRIPNTTTGSELVVPFPQEALDRWKRLRDM